VCARRHRLVRPLPSPLHSIKGAPGPYISRTLPSPPPSPEPELHRRRSAAARLPPRSPPTAPLPPLQAAGEFPLLLLFLSMPSPSKMAHRNIIWPSSGEPPPLRPPAPPPIACTRPGPSDRRGRPRSKGGMPLRSVHRGPVDQVHRRRSTSLRQPGQSQLATWRHLSFPVGRPGTFANKPPISGIYKNSLPPYKTTLPFSGLDPRFSNLSNPRSRAHPFASKPSSFHI
jgi:hypothetical protein